jgi:hypothetical protein
MHACVLETQGVLRVADELIVDIWLPLKVHTDISRRKIGEPHVKLHGIALLRYGGERVAKIALTRCEICQE